MLVGAAPPPTPLVWAVGLPVFHYIFPDTKDGCLGAMIS